MRDGKKFACFIAAVVLLSGCRGIGSSLEYSSLWLSSAQESCTEDSARGTLEEIFDRLQIPKETDHDLDLPDTIDGTVISYVSSDESLLSAEGIVHRPPYLSSPAEVTLHVTVGNGTETAEKEYTLTILPEETPEAYYDYGVYVYGGPDIDFMKEYAIAGLYDTDVQRHSVLLPHYTTGKSINVLYYGAIAGDESYDNTPAFKAAIQAAEEGDEIFVPEGVYYFRSNVVATPVYAHIQLKSNVNLRGEGKEKTVLVSAYSESEYVNVANTAILSACNVENVMIRDLQVKGVTLPEEDMPADINDGNTNNPSGDAQVPQFGIVVQGSSAPTSNVIVVDCKVQYFSYSGIRLHDVSDCQVVGCSILNATDLGGGGAGYGIEVRGYGHERFEYIGTDYDICYNVVAGNIIEGPYIRHAITLTYMAHNNLVLENTITDCMSNAIDTHGQDEFLNVICGNTVLRTRIAAGIGLGNLGSTHDSSGAGNVVLGNTVQENLYGIRVCRATHYTYVVSNVATGNINGDITVTSDCVGTILQDNTIS